MQGPDGVYDAKIDLSGQRVLFPRWRRSGAFALLPLAAYDLSAINASSLTVKPFSIRDDNLQNWLCASLLSVMQGVTYEQFEWFVRQSEERISMVIA